MGWKKPSGEGVMVRRMLIEWLILLLLLSCAVAWLSGSRLVNLANLYAYDRVLPAHARMADERVVLVTIDEPSVASLGRWPWPRTLHAQLFERLAEQRPRAVLFDVLLTEPSADDAVLATSMARLPNLALPVLLENNDTGGLHATRPVVAAAALGHIALAADEDAVVRRAKMQRTDDEGHVWPLLTVVVAGDAVPAALPDDVLIPFNVPAGSYQSFSYADVLAGRVPAGFLTDKYVLIGATSQGLGDRYSTPSSGHFAAMPGIEIHANILDALLNDLSVSVVAGALWSVLPAVLLLVLLLYLRERYHLLAAVLALLAYVALVCGLLWYGLIWLPPVAGVVGLLLAYVLWSWLRLSVVVRHVRAELRDLRRQTGQVFQLLPASASARGAFRPPALELDIAHARYLSRFVTDSMQRLPVAMCLADETGTVLMHNQLAAQVFGDSLQAGLLSDVLIDYDAQANAWASDDCMSWQGRELHGASGVYELHVVALNLEAASAQQQRVLWQVSLIDLSNERAAQHQRNNLMAFLSHDLRAPQVGILSLMTLYSAVDSDMSLDDMMGQIKSKVNDTLGWANDLVGLARAQNREFYRMTEVNAVELVYGAVEQVWSQASAKQIELVIDERMNDAFDHMWLNADGSMLTRAFVNLLVNAVRYSAAGTQVHLSLDVHGDGVLLRIVDQGDGMSAQQIQKLNSGTQSAPTARVAVDAAGSLNVGLHMVREVLRQHDGWLCFVSDGEKGTEVRVYLPVAH